MIHFNSSVQMKNKMNLQSHQSFSLWIVIIVIGLLSCDQNEDHKPNTKLIPYPTNLSQADKYSDIEQIKFDSDDVKSLDFSPQYFKEAIDATEGTKKETNVRISVDNKLSQGAYVLEIKNKNFDISYGDRGGFFNALSSVKQLLFLNDGKLPLVKIEDSPKYSYRGMHLDVSRHMFTLEEVKKYIDYLSFYKYNYFHWHLTDDQGWRIEIKKYPKIQEIAAFRNETLVGHYNDEPHQYDNTPYGGFYTQEEIKELVAYANQRGIEVIPEIDIPGHCAALIAAYPELSCHKNQIETATKWGIFEDVLCPTEETFEFLENVFNEVIALFPSNYIHIGGDECPKVQWEESDFCQQLMKEKNLNDELQLQSYFIQRIEKYLQSKNKNIIGWDEILEGGISNTATIMSWRGDEGGLEAASHGNNVIMTPTSYCYFDYYQSEDPDEPLAIGGQLSVEKVYNWNILPKGIKKNEEKYILGAQGNLWSEYIKTFKDLEYMSLARMITLSEILWGKNEKDSTLFWDRLSEHSTRWIDKEVNIAYHLLELKTDFEAVPNQGVFINCSTLLKGTNLKLTTPENKQVQLKTDQAFQLKEKGKYLINSIKDNLVGKTKQFDFYPHKGNLASIELINKPKEKYSGNGPTSLINGIIGSNERYGGAEWFGYEGEDFKAILSFQNPTYIDSISFKFFKGEGQWIYLPSEINVYKIDKNDKQQLIANSNKITTTEKIGHVVIKIEESKIDRILIEVKNFGEIPKGNQGAGYNSWLFMDEIIIE